MHYIACRNKYKSNRERVEALKIIQLPASLANKIAAGEVVERPASVVKELMENSIDAKSTWIKIDLIEAGLEEIKITDDGEGMSPEDCERAFLRHATSKIKYETDLFHIGTLGFRGEALASIASVSKLTIKTSLGEEAGTLLQLEGGEITHRDRSDARQGTEITVQQLFFNTPARLKYMKTLHTELGHITDVLNRIALANPSIRIEVTHNGKRLFQTTGSGDGRQVIANIYGMNVAKQMLAVEKRTLDFQIQGFVSKPELTRASRSYISIIINGRYIRSHALNHAITRAYHTLLPINRYPVAVLAIQMDPILVDVNVHPTKLEVRFSKEKELIEAIEVMIRDNFRKQTLIPEIKPKPTTEERKSVQHELDFNQWQKHVVPEPYKVNETMQIHETPVFEHKSITEELPNQIEQEIHIEQKEPKETPLPVQENSPQIEVEPQQRVPVMYPVGQVQGTYIIAQNEQGLYLIDQHAAQERIKYEFFKEKLGKTINESQELLIPLTFEFSKTEAIFIEKFKEEFEKVGLFFESFGHQTYIIRSHPTWFPKGFEIEIIQEMVEQIIQNEKINIEKLREEAAILMSCKRSIKANHYLNDKDMFRLLEDLRNTVDPFTCPHGRPIIIHFSSYDLEKMFNRVM